MDRKLAEFLSKKFKIDISQIVREFWEMILLYEFFSFEKSKYLIFKGGTALRLAYKSPRFSEDLDFSLISTLFTEKDAEKMIYTSTSNYNNISINDYAFKYNTFFYEIKIEDSCLLYPFRIKIEISKRDIDKKYEYIVTEISSEVFPYKLLANVVTMKQIYYDKYLCITSRCKPRDYFDFWYLSQALNIPYEIKSVINKTEMTRELRKYLPKNYYKIIDSL